MASDILGQVYLESHFTARQAQSFQTVLLSLGYKEKMEVTFPNARTQEACLKLYRMTLTLSISEGPEHLYALFTH